MPGTLKLEKLIFQGGPNPGADGLEVTVPTVTVLVGPNNSGKSLALREVENWCWNVEEQRKVIAEVEVSFPTSANDGIELIEKFKTDPPPNQAQAADHIWIGLPTFRGQNPVLHEQVSLNSLRSAIEGNNLGGMRQVLTRPYTIRLDGRTRFSLSDPKPAGDLQSHPQNHLWALFQDETP